jgi:hypothetical protein
MAGESMAQQEIVPNPGGPNVDLSVVPAYLADMMYLRTTDKGFILTFMRNETPYPVCVARVALAIDRFPGVVAMLVAAAKQRGIEVPELVPAEDEKPSGH